jgi:hypothetical protein
MRCHVPRGAFLGTLLLLLPLGTAAAETATAHGSWTVAGKTVALEHLRAFREADPFGHGTNPCLLASNQPVPDDAVPADDDGISKLLDKMRAGGLVALQVCFDATGRKLREVDDVVVFHPDISPGRFAIQGFHTWAVKVSAPAGRIAGRLTGAGTTMSDAAWSDQVDLDAPLPAEKD